MQGYSHSKNRPETALLFPFIAMGEIADTSTDVYYEYITLKLINFVPLSALGT